MLSTFEKIERMIPALKQFNQVDSLAKIKEQMKKLSIIVHHSRELNDDEREIIGQKIHKALYGFDIGADIFPDGCKEEKEIMEEKRAIVEEQLIKNLKTYFGKDVLTRIQNKEQLF